jgi:hypothetical protein
MVCRNARSPLHERVPETGATGLELALTAIAVRGVAVRGGEGPTLFNEVTDRHGGSERRLGHATA